MSTPLAPPYPTTVLYSNGCIIHPMAGNKMAGNKNRTANGYQHHDDDDDDDKMTGIISMTLTGMTKYSHGPTNGLFTPKGKMTPPSLNMCTNNHRHLLPTKGTQQLQQWQLQLITANPKGKLHKWTKIS
jgi:hypothetical protein